MDVVDSVAVEAVIVEDAVDSAVVEVVTVEDVEDSADVAVVTVDAEVREVSLRTPLSWIATITGNSQTESNTNSSQDVVVTADVAHQEDVVEPEPREEQRPLSSHIATLVSLLPAERRICW